MYRHPLGLISLHICTALPWDRNSDGQMLFKSRYTLAHLATLCCQYLEGRRERGKCVLQKGPSATSPVQWLLLTQGCLAWHSVEIPHYPDRNVFPL